MNRKRYKRAFTLIELLIIVAIIGLLSTVILISITIARDKAAVNSYKTSMRAARTGLELCWVGGGTLVSGNAGVHMCSTPSEESLYPTFSNRCGGEQPRFSVNMSGTVWSMSTISHASADPWYCKGCRLVCTVTECVYDEITPGACS